MAWIRDMAEKLPIQSDSKFGDVVATVSPAMAKQFWQKRSVLANFLKHADRDPKARIELNDVDNLQLLMQAYSAYVDLVHDELEAEGLVLLLYYSVASGSFEDLDPRFQDTAKDLGKLPPTERMRLCSDLIRQLNETE
ncbi:MAG: hypothetical protein U1E63_03490 [Burkholderiales bacterium]